MKAKQLGVFIILCFTTLIIPAACSQKKTTDNPPSAKKDSGLTQDSTVKKPILLDDYLIDPANKTISVQVYFERDEPNGRHAWGTESKQIIKDTDFETTCLYVTDSLFGFKEEHYNLPQLTFINKYREPLDITEFKHISNRIYKKENTYYFADSSMHRFHQLYEIVFESDINADSLIFAGKNFCYDNHGLYYLANGDNGDLKLITVAKGKNCQPVIKRTYCEYNGSAFNDELEKLDASLSKLHEIDPYRDGRSIFLTDGTTFFKTRNNRVEKKVPGLKRWKQLSTGQELDVENNCVNLSLSFGGSGNDILFFSPNEGFFTWDFYSLEKRAHYKKVTIFNYDKDGYEEMDVSRFELCAKDFFTYKDKLYYNCVRVDNDLDAAKLRYITGSPNSRYIGSTSWMTDGKLLIHLGTKKSMHKDGIKKFTFGPEVLVANIKQLKLVSESLLVDDVNFYQFNGSAIEVIPIESLGIKVKIDLSNYAWEESE